MKLTPLILGVLLAVASFAFARHQYTSQNSVTFSNPFNTSQSKTLSVADRNLFGDWIKDQWLFAIALPVGLIVGGAALAVKK